MITLELLQAVDHIAWIERCLFRDDFINAFISHPRVVEDWDDMFALVVANDLWKSLEKQGLVKTYQEYISDQELMSIMLDVVNIKV